MSRQTIAVWTFVLLFSLPLFAVARTCSKSADCNDKQHCTVDLCDPVRNSCINLPTSSLPSCNGTGTFTTALALRKGIEATALPAKDRLRIVTEAIRIMRDFHPHRIMYMTYLGVDPVPALTALRNYVLDEMSLKMPKMSVFQFHQKMIGIFSSIHDRHTAYIAPPPLKSSMALLPFLFRHYYQRQSNRTLPPIRYYVVTDLASDFHFTNPAFKRGVRIVGYNSIPIDEAVRQAGIDGANMAAKIARGARLLTRRHLSRHLAPVAQVVTISFIDHSGRMNFINVPWLYTTLKPTMPEMDEDTQRATEQSMYSPTAFTAMALAMLPKIEKMSKNTPKISSDTPPSNAVKREIIAVDDLVCDSLSAEVISTKSGKVGVIKVRNFTPLQFTLFPMEYLRVLLKMRDIGVVIDIRGNVGGFIHFAQLLISFFAERRIKPVTFAFRVTPLTAKVQGAIDVAPNSTRRITAFTESITAALKTGDPFSGSMDLIPDGVFNNYNGTKYKKQVFVLTDGETYSAGDIFAASCQDNKAAIVVGTDAHTGGGGSTVLPFNDIMTRRYSTAFSRLPGNVDFQTSVLRVNRAGPNAGIPIESFGVTPQVRYYPTLRDRLEDDVDLFEFLGKLISDANRNDMSDPIASVSDEPAVSPGALVSNA